MLEWDHVMDTLWVYVPQARTIARSTCIQPVRAKVMLIVVQNNCDILTESVELYSIV